MLTVFRKEMLDLFRDKRTIITSIVVPIVLYPLLMIGFSSITIRQTHKLMEQEVQVYVVDNADNDYSQMVIEELDQVSNIKLSLWPQAEYIYEGKSKAYQTELISELLMSKAMHAAVKIDIEDEGNEYNFLDIVISYNQVDERSELASNLISRALSDLEKELVIQRLQAVNISESILKAMSVEHDDQASEDQTMGLVLARILPYLLIIISLSGSAVAATDLVAGEKERGTLETILVSAAQRNELVVGKFLAVITISMMTVVLNLLSIFFSFRHVMSQAAAEISMMQIPFGNLMLIMLLMFPLLIFFSALLLSLSTYARNMKEGYSYFQPVMIGAMLMSLISALPAIETTFGLALIPVINVSLIIKDIMIGNLHLGMFFTALSSSLVLVVVAIYFSIKLFSNETVLFRTTEDSALFRDKKGKLSVLNPGFAILFFVLILVLFYYVGMSWQTQDLEQGLMKTLLFLVLLPTLLVVKFGKLNMKEVLSLNRTKPVNLPLVLLTAIPVFILVTLLTQVINLIYPFPESYLEAMQDLVLFEGRSVWFVLFLIALLPGVTEEIMFRGYFIKAFQSKGLWKSIVISGILFAILHMDVYRLVPIALLGIWMGYLLVKTQSIFVPIVAHFANNALAVLIGRYGDSIPGVSIMIKDDMLAWWLIVPASAAFLFLLYFFNRINPRDLSEMTQDTA